MNWDIRYPELLSIAGFKPLLFKKRTGMRGGGVGFYVNNKLNAKVIENLSPFENKIIESLTIQLTYPDQSQIYVTSVYRSNGHLKNVSPAQQMERFNSKFDELLSSLQQTRKESYVFIDANIDLLHLGCTDSQNYMNLILGKSYLQCVAKATRIQNNSKSLIDHILINSGCRDIFTGTLISDVSDHFFTFVSRPCPTKMNLNCRKTMVTRDFSHNKMQNFKTMLGGSNWDNVTSANDVDLAYEAFWSIYKACFSSCFPLKRTRINKNFHKVNNFMTGGLLKSRVTKNKLHKTAISTPTVENIVKYKRFKTLYQRVVRAAKKLYFTNKLAQNAYSPKKTWETLNEVLGKTSKSKSVEQININGIPETDPSKIARHFNEFFSSVGHQISNSVSPIDKKPEEFINYGENIPDLRLMNTTPEHVKKIISKSKTKYSCDAQGISTKMIIFIGHEIATPLAHIFNLSLGDGKFPSKLKKCRVIPIFKTGNSLDCDNYRPISLLSAISKVLEKIVADRLVTHLTINDLLYVNQYGFLPKKSAEHNLMQILNYVSAALNEGNFCIGVFLDLKKAFDVCSHEILLKKLQLMGIRGVAHKWFESYLQGRTQSVDIDGTTSDELSIDISVIQGSILGPILFLCYINDFFTATTLFSVLFADDTTCLAKGKNLNDLTAYVNSELQKVANWYRANKMAINTSKTKFIVFRTHGKKIEANQCILNFNCNEIGKENDPSLIFPIDRISNDSTETSFKLLGVLFDEYLSFDAHITHLCTKIAKSLFCINRVKNFVTHETLKLMYFAMIHSHIVYCINIYGCANKTTLNKLWLKQKEAIRVISNAPYRAHSLPLFINLKILPINELIKFSNLKFMHNYCSNKLPITFRELWMRNRERQTERNLRNMNDFNVPPHHFATVKRFPLFTFPQLWNDEPERKNTQSIFIYLKQLKTVLLDSLVDHP